MERQHADRPVPMLASFQQGGLRLSGALLGCRVDYPTLADGLPKGIDLGFESFFPRRSYETRELGVRRRRSTIAGLRYACAEQAIAG